MFLAGGAGAAARVPRAARGHRGAPGAWVWGMGLGCGVMGPGLEMGSVAGKAPGRSGAGMDGFERADPGGGRADPRGSTPPSPQPSPYHPVNPTLRPTMERKTPPLWPRSRGCTGISSWRPCSGGKGWKGLRRWGFSGAECGGECRVLRGAGRGGASATTGGGMTPPAPPPHLSEGMSRSRMTA